MRMIAPQVEAPHVTVAEDQEEFKPITAAIVRHSQGVCHLLAFRPSPEERQRLADGEDLYISLLTFGGPMQGIIVLTGKQEASSVFGVPVSESRT
jgi:hypothetical protein